MPRVKKLTDYLYSPTNPASEDAIRLQIDDSIQEVYDAAALTVDVVLLTTDQTINGIKTFVSSPVVPTPVLDFQAASKKYIDDVAANFVLGELSPGSVTEEMLSDDVQDKIVAWVRPLTDLELRTQEVEDNLAIQTTIGPNGTTYTQRATSNNYATSGTVDFGKIYAETVTTGTDALVATALQVSSDGETPTNLSDCITDEGLEVTMQDSQEVDNSVLNPNFDGTTDWSFVGDSFTVSNDIASVTNGASTNSLLFQSKTFNTGDVYFVCAKVRVTNADCTGLSLRLFSTIVDTVVPNENEYNYLNGIVTASGESDIRVRQLYPSSVVGDGKVMEVDGLAGVFAIDLTETGLDIYLEALGYTTDEQKETFLVNFIQEKGVFELETLTQKENLTVSDINDGTDTLTFTSDIVNEYPNGANVYRSNLTDDWEFGKFISPALAYELDKAFYDGNNKNVSAQDANPTSVTFSTDGTKMYILGGTNQLVYQYTLSTPGDVSTSTYDSKNFNVGAQDNQPKSIFFSVDGTKMYYLGSQNDNVYQYTLSTPGDVSTAAYDSVSFSISAQENLSQGFWIKNDGTKMYIIGIQNQAVYQYTLSTPGDISTASYDNKNFNVSTQDATPRDVSLNEDLTKMFFIGGSNDSVYQYTLSTPGDISTAIYDSVSLSVSAQETSPEALIFSNDGTYLYIVGLSSDAVFRYSTEQSIPITDIDIRINIQAFTDKQEISAFIETNDFDTVTLDGSLSIRESGNPEVYVNTTDVKTDEGTNNMYMSVGEVSTGATLATMKYELTRESINDNVQIKRVQGGLL